MVKYHISNGEEIEQRYNVKRTLNSSLIFSLLFSLILSIILKVELIKTTDGIRILYLSVNLGCIVGYYILIFFTKYRATRALNYSIIFFFLSFVSMNLAVYWYASEYNVSEVFSGEHSCDGLYVDLFSLAHIFYPTTISLAIYNIIENSKAELTKFQKFMRSAFLTFILGIFWELIELDLTYPNKLGCEYFSNQIMDIIFHGIGIVLSYFFIA
jgi:hypothetical protein